MVIVAAAQIPVTNDYSKNLNTILSYIKKAAKKQVDIICFPETSLVYTHNKKQLQKIDFPSLLNKIKNACRENRIHCIFSTYVLDKNKIHNRAFLIDDLGKVIFSYDKINLWLGEKRKRIVQGKKNKIINTKFGKIGIIICWDIAHQNFVQDLAKQGAWVIFCPSYLTDYDREVDSYLQIPYVRAFENSCGIVFVDAFSKKTLAYSCICTPDKMHAEIRKKEGMILAKLDKKKIEKIRKHYKLIKTSSN